MKLLTALLAASVAIASSFPHVAIAQNRRPVAPPLCETYKVLAMRYDSSVLYQDCKLAGAVVVEGHTLYMWELGRAAMFVSDVTGNYVYTINVPDSVSDEELRYNCQLLIPHSGLASGEAIQTQKGNRGCSFF